VFVINRKVALAINKLEQATAIMYAHRVHSTFCEYFSLQLQFNSLDEVRIGLLFSWHFARDSM